MFASTWREVCPSPVTAAASGRPVTRGCWAGRPRCVPRARVDRSSRVPQGRSRTGERTGYEVSAKKARTVMLMGAHSMSAGCKRHLGSGSSTLAQLEQQQLQHTSPNGHLLTASISSEPLPVSVTSSTLLDASSAALPVQAGRGVAGRWDGKVVP